MLSTKANPVSVESRFALSLHFESGLTGPLNPNPNRSIFFSFLARRHWRFLPTSPRHQGNREFRFRSESMERLHSAHGQSHPSLQAEGYRQVFWPLISSRSLIFPDRETSLQIRIHRHAQRNAIRLSFPGFNLEIPSSLSRAFLQRWYRPNRIVRLFLLPPPRPFS